MKVNLIITGTKAEASALASNLVGFTICKGAKIVQDKENKHKFAVTGYASREILQSLPNTVDFEYDGDGGAYEMTLTIEDVQDKAAARDKANQQPGFTIKKGTSIEAGKTKHTFNVYGYQDRNPK